MGDSDAVMQPLLMAVTLAIALPSLGLSQPINYPRQQIALHLGASQMGYDSPFWPTTAQQQEVINAVAQGRLAILTKDGQTSVNVVGAENLLSNAESFRRQIDLALEAVLAAPKTVSLKKGKAILSYGSAALVTATSVGSFS